MYEPDVYAVFNFSSVVADGVANTIDYPIPGITDLPGPIEAMEVHWTVTSKTGAGVTPTLDLSIQSSPDNFQTAGLTDNLMVFTQATATTSGESKVVSVNDGLVHKWGKNRRIHLVADAASGAVTFESTVQLIIRLRC